MWIAEANLKLAICLTKRPSDFMYMRYYSGHWKYFFKNMIDVLISDLGARAFWVWVSFENSPSPLALQHCSSAQALGPGISQHIPHPGCSWRHLLANTWYLLRLELLGGACGLGTVRQIASMATAALRIWSVL